jgi:hypothetical protein
LNDRVLAAGVRPACRSMMLGSVTGLLVLAATPAVVTAARGGRDLSGALVAGAVVTGAVPAFVVGEPAASILDAAPTPSWYRRLTRLAAVTAAASVTMAVVVTVARLQDPSALDQGSGHLAALLATGGLAGAAAVVLDRRGSPNAAVEGATVGPLAVLVISVLAVRVQWLPMLVVAGRTRGWWWIALGSWTVGAWASRDRYGDRRRATPSPAGEADWLSWPPTSGS